MCDCMVNTSLLVALQDFVIAALLIEKEDSCKSALLFKESYICTTIKYRSQLSPCNSLITAHISTPR